jgi:signal transduction histidine kinase
MPDADRAAAKILIVDDEPTIVRLLERLLKAANYGNVMSTTDAREVVGRYRAFRPDIVLLDLMMPHLDGVAVLGQLRAEMPPPGYLPILILTADVSLDAKNRALAAGASDFLTKPFEQIEVLLRIGNLLDTRRLYLALEAQNRSLEQTVRERTERLLQSEKVATMGSLLAGVAHELNNPLAALSGHAQLLRQSAQEPALVRRAEKIDQAATRCVRIVRNFLSLARQRVPERSHVWLKAVVEEAVELLAYELRTGDVELSLDLEKDLPRLWADPHQLNQVLVNLLANANQAMRRSPRPRRIAITAHHDAARARVRLEVADSGPGIPSEIQDKIFEPFFTTKPAGEGTGLGLSLCRGIIEEHGGTIEVDSKPGHGTRFVIDLPVVIPPRRAAQSGGDEALPLMASKLVLVVDDEADVGSVIAEAITQDGHQVDVATNGAMALEMLGQRRYEIVISDTKMPGMDGEALYAELGRRVPTLRERVIFLTGDVLSREKQEFLERTGNPFLAKPCDLGELRRLVRRVAAGPSAQVA